MWRVESDGLGHDPSLTVTHPLDPNRAVTMVHSGRGGMFRVCPETREPRGIAFEGSGCDRETLRSAAAQPKHTGIRFRMRGPQHLPDDRRQEAGDYGRGARSPSWKRGYGRRSALERTDSRIDRVHRMETHFVRGRSRMALRRGLAVAVMVVAAPGRLRAGPPEKMRSPVRGPDPKSPEAEPREPGTSAGPEAGRRGVPGIPFGTAFATRMPAFGRQNGRSDRDSGARAALASAGTVKKRRSANASRWIVLVQVRGKPVNPHNPEKITKPPEKWKSGQ